MARVKTGTIRRRRHRQVLKTTKGYRMTRRRLYKVAHEAMLHAGQHAYIGRKEKKGNFRRLWIQRINAGLSQIDQAPSYHQFISQLKQAKIELNRKILAELAVNDFDTFQLIVKQLPPVKPA